MTDRYRPTPLDAALGITVLATALLLLANAKFAVLPPVILLHVLVVASFMPRVSFFLPVVTRGHSGKHAVALTFDDGPDPRSTPQLLAILARHQSKATFFVTGKNAALFPALITEIVRHGHTVGNHSYSHDHFLAFRSFTRVRNEIEKTQRVFEAHGIRPCAFRPPLGFIGIGFRRVLSDLGMFLVNFSFRPNDAGNRWIDDLARRILSRVRPDDIILLHDTVPPDPAQMSVWLSEIEALVTGLNAEGFAILPLAELIERPVLEVIGLASHRHPPRRGGTDALRHPHDRARTAPPRTLMQRGVSPSVPDTDTPPRRPRHASSRPCTREGRPTHPSGEAMRPRAGVRLRIEDSGTLPGLHRDGLRTTAPRDDATPHPLDPKTSG